MNQWQHDFAKRVESLRDASVRKFEQFADECLNSVFREFSDFASRHEFQCSEPKPQRGVRFYKFAIAEDAYVLMYMRSRGIDAVEWEYECSVPGRGCVEGDKENRRLTDAGRAWVERCFQTALDDLVNRVSETAVAEEPELVAG